MRAARQLRRAYGKQAVGQAYNPNTGAYAATHQASNAYGSYGSSVASKNGNTAYTQHQTTSQGSVGTVQTSAGGKGAAASGTYGNSGAVGQTANGNKYAAANGNVYKNTGSGWNQTQGTPSTHTSSLTPGAQLSPLPLTAMEVRKRAAGHRPLAAAVEVAGNPGKQVLAVRQAAAVVAAGEVPQVRPTVLPQTKLS